jgi:D-aminopeptidase
MKILIAADMEGIIGVVNWDHADPNHGEYTRFRHHDRGGQRSCPRHLTARTDAVISDGHGSGTNILVMNWMNAPR